MSKYFDGEKLSGYEESPITYVYGGNLEECHKKISDLEAKLAEKERQYETLYKLFSEQHEIIDQNELECFEEVSRLLKEQKDFYVVEKTEYDKMKQGAKDIVNQLKQQLAEKDIVIERLTQTIDKLKNKKNIGKSVANVIVDVYEPMYKSKCDEVDEFKKQLEEKERQLNLAEELLVKQEKEYDEQLKKQATIHYKHLAEQDQSKTEFAIQQLKRVKEEMHRGLEFDYDLDIWATEFIDTIINEIKEEWYESVCR